MLRPEIVVIAIFEKNLKKKPAKSTALNFYFETILHRIFTKRFSDVCVPITTWSFSAHPTHIWGIPQETSYTVPGRNGRIASPRPLRTPASSANHCPEVTKRGFSNLNFDQIQFFFYLRWVVRKVNENG